MLTYIVSGLLIWGAAMVTTLVALTVTLTVMDIRAARRRAKAAQKRGFPWAWDNK